MRTSTASKVRTPVSQRSGAVRPLTTYTVGNVRISCVHRDQAVDNFFKLVSAQIGGFITVRDAHGIVASQTDKRLLQIVNDARMTLPDGMPVVWVGKLKKAEVQRVSGAEFFDSVIRDPRGRRIRHFFYGSKEKTIKPLVDRVTNLVGSDAVCGWHCPPMRPPGAIEDDSVLKTIAAARPDVIWVGLSTPKRNIGWRTTPPIFRIQFLLELARCLILRQARKHVRLSHGKTSGSSGFSASCRSQKGFGHAIDA